jgi:predicted component of viral defense system (DUF524 family)
VISLDAISIILDEPSGLAVTIAASRLDDPIDCTSELPELPDGFLGKLATKNTKAPIIYSPDARHKGRQPLSIKEVRRYSLTVHFLNQGSDLDASALKVESSLRNGKNAKWNLRKIRGTQTGELQIINYIGTAWIQIQDFPRIKLEITPEKIDYEVEYRSMVESIASQCQQLLLEWNTPTTLSFTPNPEEAKRTLLEQFLFLRHSLGTDRLDLYLEILGRNPHRGLLHEDRWGSDADSRFFRDPIRYGREWLKVPGDNTGYFKGRLPHEINSSHKRETLDTAPNRFVKYALGQFLGICQAVIEHSKIEGAANDEAIAMGESLEIFLAQQWLWEVGELDQIPFNNQTLLRREGYRQLLEAWFLSDVAAQLDWEGREDAYDGNNRDVATLYEYWLYFEFLTLLTEDVGCEHIAAPIASNNDSALPFIAQVEGKGIRVNLKQGRASYSAFRFTSKDGIVNRLNLYFNRAFQQQPVLKSGSYSRPLRPDYSLVILPESIAEKHKNPYTAEAEAESSGQITYLHFDAKYRVETITDIFGNGSVSEAEEERREEKVTRTYKRGDLYKMHTYNEAIRRTVGSYVLYPGTDLASNPDFKKYHELLPGVGAFVMRPTVKDGAPSADGREVLAKFLKDVVIHQADRMTQSFRIRQTTHKIVKDSPKEVISGGISRMIANPETPVILGYMKTEEDMELFRDKKFFYCWATDKKGTPVKLDLSISAGTLLLGYTGPHQQRVSTHWCAEITRCELVTGNQLKERVHVTPKQDISHYLLFHLEEPWSLAPRDLTGIAPPAGGLAVQKKWIDIAGAMIKE